MLFKFLAKYRDAGLLVMRIGLGAMFMMHGLPKLAGGPAEWTKLGGAMANLGIDVWPTVWGFIAAATEGVGGLLVIIGLLYRPICLLLMFTMIAAASTHLEARDDFKSKTSRPIELAFVFLGLAFAGPGRFSVDKD